MGFPRRWPMAAASLALALLAGCADAPAPGTRIGPATVHATAIGPVLADADGMTLYRHADDENGVPICYGRCATSWPPFLAPAAARPTGRFTLAPRKEGTIQWVYDGHPLYRWEKDKRPGDATGDKVGDVWFVVRP